MFTNIICLLVFLTCATYIKGLPDLGITNGQDAKEGQFPYQVSVQQCYNLLLFWSCDHYCAGTILSPKWIVTAGHCNETGDENRVLAGVYKLNERSDFKQFVTVKQVIVHEDYGGTVGPNDIALLELSEPLKLNERVQPITLPKANYETTGLAVTTGWGVIEDGHMFPDMSNVLQFIEIPIYSGKECMDIFEDALKPSENLFNTTTNVCTFDAQTPNRGLCEGDSGGALVQNDTLIGISSWIVSPCGSRGAPSAYTKVSNYISWINNHTGLFFNEN